MYSLFLSDLNETRIFWTFFKKYTDIKFNKNPYSGSRFVSSGETDMTKLITAFRNFANAPKNEDSQRPVSGYTCCVCITTVDSDYRRVFEACLLSL
jgi:hypothetical protein